MKVKRVVLLLLTAVTLLMLVGCELDSNSVDKKATEAVSKELASNQPTPRDIEFSLERYNLIKRAY